MNDTKIIGVPTHADCGVVDIVMVPGIDDRVILEAVRSVPERAPASLVDHLSAMVANEILKLNISHGAGLVIPLAAFLHRQVMVDSANVDDGSLFSLWKLLHETRDSAERVRVGLRLGDRGLGFASQLFGGSHLARVMNPKERRNYSCAMATSGYGEALLASSDLGRTESRAVRAHAPVILRRMGDIVKILSGISGTKLKAILGHPAC